MARSFVHLHTHSFYSFLDGTASPADLVARAAALGQGALALTDHAGLFGAAELHAAARRHGVRPIYGAEVDVSGLGHLTLLVRDAAGWRSLCRLLTAAQLAGRKGHAPVAPAVLARHTDGLICLTGCRRHGALAAPLLRGDEEAAREAATRLHALFGDDLWIEIPRNRAAGDAALGRALAALADRLGVGAVATANAHYCLPGDGPVADTLACIRAGTTLTAARHLRENHRHDLAPTDEMHERCADLPGVAANTALVARRCAFDLDLGRHRFPAVALPPGRTAEEELRARCRLGLTRRYAGAPPALRARARERLDHELGVVGRLGLARYFLIVEEVVRAARAMGVACQGRGSAAGSVIAYTLGISRVEPLAQGLLFERFLSDERAAALPDIDVDFAASGRERVIAWIHERFGAASTGTAITFQAYHRQGATRDVGKALGIPPATLAALLRRLRWRLDDDLAAAIEAVAGPGAAGRAPWSLLLALVPRLVGLPRHTGLHNGGMIIVNGPLADLLPVERAAMPGRLAVQADKDALEALGLVKLDILGLQALDLVSEAARLIGDGRGGPFDLDRIPLDDPAVFAMLADGETIGLFQLESPAQQALLPTLRPRCLDDLTVAISLIRPGPVQAGMVPAYLARRRGAVPVSYAHPLLEPVLKDTLGVFLYQESVLGAAVALAGFSPGEADELRRAMGSKRSAEKMAALEGRFLAGAAAKGVSGATARAVFDAIRAFSSYGFVKAHSCSFARLAYETAWLKRHHPVAFWAARLTAQPGGGWPVGAYINAARRDGVTVLGPDLGRSGWRCTIEEAPAGPAVRLGLWFVRGLAGDAGPRLVAERDRRGAFRDLSDLCRRAREFLTPTAIEALIAAGACDGWGLPRRALLWRLPAAWRGATGLDLPPAAPDLPPADPGETLAGEAWAAGAALGGHPVALTRSALDAAGIVPLRALATAPAGMFLAVAGRAVLIRRPPTADGICFVSLEDETAVATLVLDEATDRRDRARLHAPLVVAEGRVVRRRGVPTLRVTMLRSFVADPPSRSGLAPA